MATHRRNCHTPTELNPTMHSLENFSSITRASISMATAPAGSAASMYTQPPPRSSTTGIILLPATLFLRPRQQSHPHVLLDLHRRASAVDLRCRRRLLTARGERQHDEDEEEDDPAAAAGFDAAAALFNRGEYHACHDVVEELWYGAEDPSRTLLHGVLQCAVGFHHLFNQNHRGAMMELGEGLCKLRKLHLEDDGGGPFSRFRDEVAAVLQFLYRTQKELAACADDLCLTMDGSPTSYQLLGNFAAGQQLYRLEADGGGASSIVFAAPNGHETQAVPPRVKLPRLHATEQNLTELQCAHEHM